MHRAVSDPPCLPCINYLSRATPFPPLGVLPCLESLCAGRGSGCNTQEMFFQIPFVAPDPLHHSAWCLLTASCVRAGNAALAEQGSRRLWSGVLGRPLAQPRLEVPVGLTPAQHRAGAKFNVIPERLSCVFFFHAERVWEIKARHRSPSCTVWCQLLMLYKGWVLHRPPSLRLDLTCQAAALCQANFWAAAPVPCCHY